MLASKVLDFIEDLNEKNSVTLGHRATFAFCSGGFFRGGGGIVPYNWALGCVFTEFFGVLSPQLAIQARHTGA